MEPIVVTPSLVTVDIVDNFDSFIWTERFDDVGEFELYLPTNSEGFTLHSTRQLPSTEELQTYNGYRKFIFEY
jgi:hypothetical protein